MLVNQTIPVTLITNEIFSKIETHEYKEFYSFMSAYPYSFIDKEREKVIHKLKDTLNHIIDNNITHHEILISIENLPLEFKYFLDEMILIYRYFQKTGEHQIDLMPTNNLYNRLLNEVVDEYFKFYRTNYNTSITEILWNKNSY